MKKGFTAAIAIGLLATAFAVSQETKKDPLTVLSDSYDLIAIGKYDEALPKLIWCFEDGPTIEPAFDPVKATCVVDALATCCEAWPAAAPLIRTKRDAKLAEMGDKIDFKSKALHDVMLYNIVLAEFSKNQEFVQLAAKDGSIKKFSSASPPPVVPGFESPDITKRVQSTLQLIQVMDDASAARQIQTSVGRCGNELHFVKDEEKVLIEDISKLTAKLKAAKTESEKASLTTTLNAKMTKLEKEVKPRKKDLDVEKEYYAKLADWHKSIP